MPENNDNEKRVIVVKSCSNCGNVPGGNGHCLGVPAPYVMDVTKHICDDTIHPSCPLPKASDFVSRGDLEKLIEIYLSHVKGKTNWHDGVRGGVNSIKQLIKSMPGIEGEG